MAFGGSPDLMNTVWTNALICRLTVKCLIVRDPDHFSSSTAANPSLTSAIPEAHRSVLQSTSTMHRNGWMKLVALFIVLMMARTELYFSPDVELKEYKRIGYTGRNANPK